MGTLRDEYLANKAANTQEDLVTPTSTPPPSSGVGGDLPVEQPWSESLKQKTGLATAPTTEVKHGEYAGRMGVDLTKAESAYVKAEIGRRALKQFNETGEHPTTEVLREWRVESRRREDTAGLWTPSTRDGLGLRRGQPFWRIGWRLVIIHQLERSKLGYCRNKGICTTSEMQERIGHEPRIRC